jgi:hypothetical protein
MYEQCYYSPSHKSIISFTHPENSELSMYGSTIKQLFIDYPDMILMPTDEASKLIQEASKTEVTETTSDQFEEMLNCLPPENWHRFEGWEFFQMCEYWTMNITAYYVRIGDKFYTFMDEAFMKPDQVWKRINPA